MSKRAKPIDDEGEPDDAPVIAGFDLSREMTALDDAVQAELAKWPAALRDLFCEKLDRISLIVKHGL